MSKYLFKTFTKRTMRYNARICKIDKQIEEETEPQRWKMIAHRKDVGSSPWGGSTLAPAADFYPDNELCQEKRQKNYLLHIYNVYRTCRCSQSYLQNWICPGMHFEINGCFTTHTIMCNTRIINIFCMRKRNKKDSLK